MPASFFDRNIVLHLASTLDKAARARAWLAVGGVVSVQVLNEVASVAIGTMKRSWDDTRDFLASVRVLVTVTDLTIEHHELGMRLAARYGLYIDDALICAAALLAECDTLYSEDMHDGLVIHDRLTIVNPFAQDPR